MGKNGGYRVDCIGSGAFDAVRYVRQKGAKKVTGAFSSLYGIINFFSDLMSYTRIFGLGLATGVIAMVFNQIAEVISGMVPIKFLGIIVSIVIYIIGHTFNVAINALGAYVHNSRLQFCRIFRQILYRRRRVVLATWLSNEVLLDRRSRGTKKEQRERN